jgi:hypothetical protein
MHFFVNNFILHHGVVLHHQCCIFNLNATVHPTSTFNHLNFLDMVVLSLFQMQKVLFHNLISLFQMLPLQMR